MCITKFADLLPHDASLVDCRKNNHPTASVNLCSSHASVCFPPLSLPRRDGIPPAVRVRLFDLFTPISANQVLWASPPSVIVSVGVRVRARMRDEGRETLETRDPTMKQRKIILGGIFMFLILNCGHLFKLSFYLPKRLSRHCQLG